MVARHAALTALACVAACARPTGDALPAGTLFPAGVAASGAPVQVVWVLRPDDYLTCQTAAPGLRDLQRATGAGVPLTIVYVGPHADWLREFLGRQRLQATVRRMDDEAFRRSFHRSPMPWLYLLDGGVVRSVLPGRGDVKPARSWPGLIRAALARQLDHGRAAGAAANSSLEGARS
jgi:hypothetical protein